MASSKGGHEKRDQAIADALAGVFGSLVSLWLFYPVDVWKTNLQAGSCPTQLSRRSLPQFFAGWPAKTLHTTTSSFCYFYLYSWIFSWWTSARKQQVSASTRLILSAIAAMLNTTLTLPFDVISARHQTNNSNTNENEYHETTEIQEIRAARLKYYDAEEKKEEETKEERHSPTMWRLASFAIEPKDPSTPNEEEGWLSLWKGLKPSLILCTNPAIHYTVFDMTKARLLNQRSKNNLNMFEAFVFGLFAKFVATMATYPLIRAKVMLMVTSKRSMLKCLVEEYRQHGVEGLYKGCKLQLLHTLMKSALLMMVRERISRTTNRMLVRESATQ